MPLLQRAPMPWGQTPSPCCRPALQCLAAATGIRKPHSPSASTPGRCTCDPRRCCQACCCCQEEITPEVRTAAACGSGHFRGRCLPLLMDGRCGRSGGGPCCCIRYWCSWCCSYCRWRRCSIRLRRQPHPRGGRTAPLNPFAEMHGPPPRSLAVAPQLLLATPGNLRIAPPQYNSVHNP